MLKQLPLLFLVLLIASPTGSEATPAQQGAVKLYLVGDGGFPEAIDKENWFWTKYLTEEKHEYVSTMILDAGNILSIRFISFSAEGLELKLAKQLNEIVDEDLRNQVTERPFIWIQAERASCIVNMTWGNRGDAEPLPSLFVAFKAATKEIHCINIFYGDLYEKEEPVNSPENGGVLGRAFYAGGDFIIE